MRRQDGQALLIVLTVMMLMQLVALAFLFRVSVEQRLAGGSLRNLQALYLAEAGLQKVLRALEEGTSGTFLPPNWTLPYQEALGRGSFTVEAIEPATDGLLAVVVRGQVAEAHRRVKALVRVGPRAFAFGLSTQGAITLAGQGRTYVIPTWVGGGRSQRLGDLTASTEIRFESAHSALNVFQGIRLPLREGHVIDHTLLGSWNVADPAGMVDVALAEGTRLFSGVAHRYVTFEELRRDIPQLGLRRVRTRHALTAPIIGEAHLRALAEANTANAAINAAVAAWGMAPGLRLKAHSRYTGGEFEAIRAYIRDEPEGALRGPVYVEGHVFLPDRERLTILDGTLAVNGDIVLMEGARVEVRHGPKARMLPGIVTWDEGSIQIQQGALVVVDGLVLADGDLVVETGVLDVIGAVTVRGFYNIGGTAVVRYDPVVLAVSGLRKPSRGIAELVSWQELP